MNVTVVVNLRVWNIEADEFKVTYMRLTKLAPLLLNAIYITGLILLLEKWNVKPDAVKI